MSLWGHARAAESSSLRDALFGHQELEAPTPMVARYQGESGQAFTFDRIDRREALLKFDNDPEIWALTPTAGPRGDVIYKNDVGQPVLRTTRLGGLTVFTAGRPEGVAVAFVGQANAPRPPVVLGPLGFTQLATQAAVRASRAVQHHLEFDAPEVTPATEGVFADAIIITAEAFVHVSQRGPDVQEMMTRFSVVRFVSGRGPGASAHGPTVQITVAPQLGIAGRPSSELIAAVLARR
ncbi:MAG: DUF4908 domain-containing protein [Caulobacteraceae bacterium]